ncbi:MAP3K7 C-terminal-like protein isoform X2 [Oxyura jamaicensis]|uniref:MAP3K7 C-terminal-like protein isoform X2 n=1 Tax=Oxyura jamaicensis TaxID=8884 RepID=UPI0015A5FAB3|nr:MAP3K7 C-terminal-like protein isoform X2 [Oxyura jamaicensis]
MGGRTRQHCHESRLAEGAMAGSKQLEQTSKSIGSSAHMITTARVPADKPVRIAFSLNETPDDDAAENSFPLAFPELDQQLQHVLLHCNEGSSCGFDGSRNEPGITFLCLQAVLRLVWSALSEASQGNAKVCSAILSLISGNKSQSSRPTSQNYSGSCCAASNLRVLP